MSPKKSKYRKFVKFLKAKKVLKRAKNNISPCYGNSIKKFNFDGGSFPLSRMFPWREIKQGYNFWNDIYKSWGSNEEEQY